MLNLCSNYVCFGKFLVFLDLGRIVNVETSYIHLERPVWTKENELPSYFLRFIFLFLGWREKAERTFVI